jgi:hypothetical protein
MRLRVLSAVLFFWYSQRYMEKPPGTEEIKEWFTARNPLGLFGKYSIRIKDIDPKPWSGHFNFLVTCGRRRFILRFRGPEWGSSRGIRDEEGVYALFSSLKRICVTAVDNST